MARWRRRPEVLWRRTLDAVVVARPERDGGDPLTIAGGGVAVWELLDAPRRLDEVVELLSTTYDADPAAVERDVAALLADLEAQGYVEQA